jgi:DNA segregation ATPase FtsK/SpoIIIE-like protein
MEAYETEKAAMGENMEKEQWMKESLQMQKASWIQDEITKRREREDELLQQIFMEQKMLQELDEDMDENMAHAREGRKYREDMKERVNDRVYEIHDLSADKREGMREYKYAYRRGYALAMFFFSLALCIFVGFLHGITSQICLMLMFFTGVQAAIFVHQKQCFFLWRLICDIFSAVVFPVMLVLFIGYELKYGFYDFLLPICLIIGLVLLALTTASYFLYDPYRSARRRVGDAKSMIRSIERSAKKQVKKSQKQQAKDELRQNRLQQKEQDKAEKLRIKEEQRQEKELKKAAQREEQQKLRDAKKQEALENRKEKKLALKDAVAAKKEQFREKFRKDGGVEETEEEEKEKAEEEEEKEEEKEEGVLASDEGTEKVEDAEDTEQGEAVVVEDAVQEEEALEEEAVPEDAAQKEEVLEEEEIVMRMEEESGDKDSEKEEVQPEDN